MGRAAPLMRVFGEDGEEESRDEIITEPSSIFNRLVFGEIFNQPLFMCSSFVIFALIELDNVSSGWGCNCSLYLSNVPTLVKVCVSKYTVFHQIHNINALLSQNVFVSIYALFPHNFSVSKSISPPICSLFGCTAVPLSVRQWLADVRKTFSPETFRPEKNAKN